MKMHTNRHQEAKLLPPDTFLSRKNAQKCVCGAKGAYSAPPDPPAGNGGGPPRKGREKERRGGEGRGKEGKGGKERGRTIPPNENPG